MSGGFTFPPPPPPPPPPPQAAPAWNAGQTTRYGSQSRGGRGRGRGRGGQDGKGRGRGNSSHGSGSQFWNGSQPVNSANLSIDRRNGSYGVQPPTQSFHLAQYSQGGLPGIPSGAYVNPNFAQQPDINGYSQGRPVHATHSNGPPPSDFPPRTFAGHKRKLEALCPPPEERQRPGPLAASAIPGFGGPILPPKPVGRLPSKPAPSQTLSLNALGLTPGEALPQYPSSDDEVEEKDVDEEALHAELGAKLTFEHNGMVLSLNSASDLAAWQEERRKKWPTRARMTEKEAERRRIGDERRRLLASAAVLNDSAASHEPRTGQIGAKTRRFSKQLSSSDGMKVELPQPKSESKLEKARRNLMEQTARLNALRKQVAAGEASLDKARAMQEDRDVEATKSMIDSSLPRSPETAAQIQQDDDAGNASDTSSEILSDSSVLSPDSSPGPDSDDDGPPEESTSKAPAKKTGHSGMLLCKCFVASGYCRDGDACRFRHELPPRGTASAMPPQQGAHQPRAEAGPKLDYSATADKKSIYQRLIEQQQEEEDRLALQVIKHLGKAGFFGVTADVTADESVQ